jgi:tRNA (guanine-N7-)-methyltransferase
MRTRKKKWAAGELSNNPRILRDEAAYTGKLREFFGNSKPIHLELGCGKGRFIIETSRRNPDTHFVAIERDETILATAARRAEENVANSLVFILHDVSEGLDFIGAGEISRLYINFCDPWSRKKKWAKRRLTHDTYLEIYEKLQIPELHFKTDNRILFEASLESLSRRNWLVKNISLDLHADNPPDNIMTEYEEKFSPHGPIYRLEAEPQWTRPHTI